MKFATKLTAAVAVISSISVPMVGVSIFYNTRNIIQETITSEQEEKTRSLLNIIDRSMYDAYQDIQLISRNSHLESFLNASEQSGKLPVARKGHQTEIDDLNNIIQSTGPWDLVSILNNKGDFVYSSQGDKVGKNIKQYSIDSVAFFAALTGQHYYSDLVISTLTTRPTIIFSAPIKSKVKGTILGVVTGHFTWPVVLQILDSTHSSDYIRLFNRDGEVIGTPTEERKGILKTRLGKYELVRQLFKGRRSDSGIIKLDEKSGFVLATAIAQDGYLSYRGNNWGLLLGVPTNVAFASVFQTARDITIIIIAIMIVILTVIYLFSRHIARPIETLRNAAVAIGSGNYNYPISIKSGDELEQLGDSIIQMASDRNQAEQELYAAQAELVRQGRLAALGQLTATVSHELRNPLATVAASMHTIRKKADLNTPALRSACQRIERSIHRCDKIIDEMLDFTRITTLETKPQKLDDWLISIIDEQTVPDGLILNCSSGLPGLIVSFDVDRLRRVIVNIYDNAVHSMQDAFDNNRIINDATLNIVTRRHKNRIEIVFTDTGVGMPEDVQSRVFEPLFSTKGFGVGLGMPIVKQIMEQHKGGIEIVSEQGRGTRVSLWLPEQPEAS
jgi:signal transduction histidine kinase